MTFNRCCQEGSASRSLGGPSVVIQPTAAVHSNSGREGPKRLQRLTCQGCCRPGPGLPQGDALGAHGSCPFAVGEEIKKKKKRQKPCSIHNCDSPVFVGRWRKPHFFFFLEVLVAGRWRLFLCRFLDRVRGIVKTLISMCNAILWALNSRI